MYFLACGELERVLRLITRAHNEDGYCQMNHLLVIRFTLFFNGRWDGARPDIAVWAGVWASGCRAGARKGGEGGGGADKATHPKGVRLTRGHRGCLALWLTDVGLLRQDLRFWK